VIAKKPLGVGSDNWAPVSEGDEIGPKDGIDGRLGQLLVNRRALSVLSEQISQAHVKLRRANPLEALCPARYIGISMPV
jgi:hypothetical protein